MTIGSRITANDEQIKFGKGYDHNFVLNGEAGTLRQAVRVTEKTSGRVMDVYTTEPGVQFYTGNFLDGSLKGQGRQGVRLPQRLLPGDAALPQLTEHTLVPVDGHQGGRALQVANRVSLLDVVMASARRRGSSASRGGAGAGAPVRGVARCAGLPGILRFRSRSWSSPRTSRSRDWAVLRTSTTADAAAVSASATCSCSSGVRLDRML